ncbi:MAG: PilT protein domain protein, partial [Geminicoccaceae bacterium]|nr:PilT protein domain protein [Geminicoccaceae bacterium]
PTAILASRAMMLALELDHPVYDCFYLALAESEQSAMLTADRRLLARLSRSNLAALAEPL